LFAAYVLLQADFWPGGRMEAVLLK
jgi:hypothetical protein